MLADDAEFPGQSVESSHDEKGSTSLQLLARGLAVLEALAAARGERGLTQAALSQRLDIQRSTLYRYLRSLQELGYVEPAPGARYRLGPRVMFLAAAGLREHAFPQYARVLVGELSRLTHETAHATIYDHGYTVSIEAAHGTGPIIPRIPIGLRRPAHCTASGKVFLAYGRRDALSAYLAEPLVARTPATITDPARLEDELDSVRRTGHATARGEYVTGICGVAEPVFDARSEVAGALALSFARDDLDAATLARVLPPLRQATRACSRLLGYPAVQARNAD